jgi:two-component system nitrate/nitrite response regulator NarL
MRKTTTTAITAAVVSEPKPTTGKHGNENLLRVLLVDDHPVVRKGLSSYLNEFAHVSVVGEAVDGEQAVEKARELCPDLVVMDMDMPRMNGLAAVSILRKENPSIKVLVLSMHSDPDSVLRIFQSGARGFVLKEAPNDELSRAIEIINSGETFFSPEVARLALQQFVRGGEGPQSAKLSNRERDVLIAIAEGLSNKEIACRLDVGVRTVETHREHIMSKLDIHTVAGLTKFAVAKGLSPLQKG